jgi:type II secretory pathway pseudopilin PulG
MRKRASKRDERRSERGFTLIELLIGMTMTLAIVIAALPIIDGAANSQGRAQTTGLAIGDARAFSELVLEDLRSAEEVTSSPTVTNSITVITGVHNTACGSGTLASDNSVRECRVSYVCSAGACTRQERNKDGTGGGNPVTMITGLSNSSAVFFPQTSGDDQVRYVDIEIVLPNKSNQGDDAIRLDDGVALRNVS